MNEFFYDSYRLVLSFLFLGMSLGVVYDVFRILRIGRTKTIAISGSFYEMIKPKRKLLSNIPRAFSVKVGSSAGTVLVFFEDLLFFLIVSWAEILWFFHVNGGELRIICILSSAFGFFLYYQTVGRLTVYFARHILFLIRCLVYWLAYVILVPIKAICRRLVDILRKLYRSTAGRIIDMRRKRRQTLYSIHQKEWILRAAAVGFCAGKNGEV